MLRILFFFALGFLVGGAVLGATTGDPGFVWMWTSALPVAIIAGTFAMVGRTLRNVRQPSPAESERAMNEGRAAIARITSVERTGTSINDVPVCRVGLIVAPRDRAAYRTETRMLIDPVAMPRYQPGEVTVVGRYDLARPEVWIITEPGTSWRNAAEEGAAGIPAVAKEWTADKNAEPVGKQPIIGIGPRGRGKRRVAYIALFAVGIAVPVGLNWQQFSAVAFHGAGGDFTQGDGQAAQRAVDELIEVIGGEQVTELYFGDGYVSAVAPTAPGAVTADDYEYRYGVAERTGPSLVQPENLAGELFDVSAVDFARLPGIVAEAARATQIAGEDAPSVRLARSTVFDTDTGSAPGPVEIHVSLSDDYFSGSYITDANGKLVTMSGGRPESDAYRAEHAGD